MVEFFEKTQSILLFIGALILVWLLMVLKSLLFKKIRARRDDLKLRFFEHCSSAVIVVFGIILSFSAFGGASYIWKSLLGGTAFVSAVVVFMAQDVIKDILAGLMISMYQPFEIGDRIQLEDGTAGVVEDVTMRHTVLARMDTVRMIIPNRRLADMMLNNYSYNIDCRSAMFTFDIAYPSDVEFARRLIRQEIMDCEYTIPGKKTKNGMDYGQVYFTAFDASSLRLQTIVYYLPGTPSEAVITDINLRVDRVLWENNIEIPYPHVTVMQADPHEVKEHRDVLTEVVWKTPNVKVFIEKNGIDHAMEETSRLGELNGLSKKQVMRLRLLGEELLRMMPEIVGDVEVNYWVEHKNKEYRIHVSANVFMTKEMRKKLLSFSSSGKNAANLTFAERMQAMISEIMTQEKSAKNAMSGTEEVLVEDIEQRSIFRWSMKKYKKQMEDNAEKVDETKDTKDENDVVWEELEQSIIARIADDVSISISGNNVEVIAFKGF